MSRFSPVVFSRESDHWATPRDVYRALSREFRFTLDPCPLHGRGGLEADWPGSVFVNPPYSNIGAWIRKGLEELAAGRASIVVYLVPSRTCTRWFHDLVLPNVTEIRFCKGRLHFNDKGPAPFPSMLLVFRGNP